MSNIRTQGGKNPHTGLTQPTAINLVQHPNVARYNTEVTKDIILLLQFFEDSVNYKIYCDICTQHFPNKTKMEQSNYNNKFYFTLMSDLFTKYKDQEYIKSAIYNNITLRCAIALASAIQILETLKAAKKAPSSLLDQITQENINDILVAFTGKNFNLEDPESFSHARDIITAKILCRNRNKILTLENEYLIDYSNKQSEYIQKFDFLNRVFSDSVADELKKTKRISLKYYTQPNLNASSSSSSNQSVSSHFYIYDNNGPEKDDEYHMCANDIFSLISKKYVSFDVFQHDAYFKDMVKAIGITTDDLSTNSDITKIIARYNIANKIREHFSAIEYINDTPNYLKIIQKIWNADIKATLDKCTDNPRQSYCQKILDYHNAYLNNFLNRNHAQEETKQEVENEDSTKRSAEHSSTQHQSKKTKIGDNSSNATIPL